MYGQRGVALILVLWLLVLLTVVAASHARIVRTETRLAFNHVEAGKARSLAEAGAYHAIMELMVRDETQQWPADGSVMHVGQPDGQLSIAIRDASGLIDINAAQPALLETVLAGLGVAKDRRRTLVDAILDWRDRDHLRRLSGAEDDDYARAGLRWAAGDGNFSSIEEFRYVLGMTNPLFERLAPNLTVYSGRGDVRREFASPWLSAMLPDTQPATPGNPTALRRGSYVFHVTVQATTQNGTIASLDMVVRITPAEEEPYRILSWRMPARTIPGSSG
jgi:general secretion pathway protein K